MERMGAARLSALMICLALAGCGGSGGSDVVSTPPPAPVTYTKLADLTGDQTFLTAGVRYVTSTAATSAPSDGGASSFGNGVAIAYLSSSDSYKVTSPDGTSTTFTQLDALPPSQVWPNQRNWSKATVSSREFFELTTPQVNGVSLSYTFVGSWGRWDTLNAQWFQYLVVGGVPTVASDMPRAGTAIYSATLGNSGATQGTVSYDLTTNSSVTFSADFARNSVTTSLTLGGISDSSLAVTPLGTFNGSGTISSTGPGFEGMLSGNGTTGTFAGAFFGPKAVEMAYAWYLNGGNLSAAGTVVGVKK